MKSWQIGRGNGGKQSYGNTQNPRTKRSNKSNFGKAAKQWS